MILPRTGKITTKNSTRAGAAIPTMRRAVGRVARSVLGTITSVETREPVVALTFDDGPDPDSTPRLLKILERRGARGTFFMIGRRAAEYPEIVTRVIAGGHSIGNHTWDHASLPLLSRRERFDQLRRCSQAFGRRELRMFRPPYGHQDNRSRLDVALAGLSVVTWSVLEPDWLDRDAKTIATGIEDKIQPGSIVLLHDGLADALDPEYFDRSPTLGAVELLLERLSSRFRFVTVPELLQCGAVRKVFWSQLPDRAFLNKLENKDGVVRSY
jgi:peptidoglycan-N-acetylglucosamine deacetylase